MTHCLWNLAVANQREVGEKCVRTGLNRQNSKPTWKGQGKEKKAKQRRGHDRELGKWPNWQGDQAVTTLGLKNFAWVAYSKVSATSSRDYDLAEQELMLKSIAELGNSLLVQGLPSMHEALRPVWNPNTPWNQARSGEGMKLWFQVECHNWMWWCVPIIPALRK